jgi:hypothetical protein
MPRSIRVTPARTIQELVPLSVCATAPKATPLTDVSEGPCANLREARDDSVVRQDYDEACIHQSYAYQFSIVIRT